MHSIARVLAGIPRIVVGIIAALGALCVLAAVFAFANREWIEEFLHLSPDGGSGETEYGLVVGFGLAALLLLALALAATVARRQGRILPASGSTAE
ncbi:hypothetical protein [Microbacterium deminutum]|uniref:ABC transporter permease n=1 Tax=Microbacterium deminutum TaxID=344164 RepID=A0ABN2RJJ2_9MICO